MSSAANWLYRVHAPSFSSSDVEHAVAVVRRHDPSGYLPGRLLPTETMQVSYYAVRSLWLQTGLRFGELAAADPAERLAWWQEGIDRVFGDAELSGSWDQATFRLLKELLVTVDWDRSHFDDIIKDRAVDSQVKQYDRLEDLVQHAEASCGRYVYGC